MTGVALMGSSDGERYLCHFVVLLIFCYLFFSCFLYFLFLFFFLFFFCIFFGFFVSFFVIWQAEVYDELVTVGVVI